VCEERLQEALVALGPGDSWRDVMCLVTTADDRAKKCRVVKVRETRSRGTAVEPGMIGVEVWSRDHHPESNVSCDLSPTRLSRSGWNTLRRT